MRESLRGADGIVEEERQPGYAILPWINVKLGSVLTHTHTTPTTNLNIEAVLFGAIGCLGGEDNRLEMLQGSCRHSSVDHKCAALACIGGPSHSSALKTASTVL